MKKFSTSWNKSKKPGKQRKYRYNAPLHTKNKLMGAHLSAELRKKHGIRSLPIKKGDKISVMRGQFKKKVGKVERVNTDKSKVYITGIEVTKKDGTKVLFPIHVSNVTITELNADDKKRIKAVAKAAPEQKDAKDTKDDKDNKEKKGE